MDPNDVTGEAFLYDAQLIAIDEPHKSLIFSVRGTYSIPVSSTTHWKVGEVGRLRLPASDCSFAFHAYPDPLLRREPSLDNSALGAWGWRLGDRRFTVRAGVIPGEGGAFIARDTEFLEIELPREFLELAAACELKPETILRGFVADLCSLMNFCSCPREDGYSSNGSDERLYAKDYFRRAYGWVLYRSTSARSGSGSTASHSSDV